MVVLQGILLLLFVITSSFTNKVLIKVLTKPKTTKEGSSVTIPCSYISEKQTTLKLLWFKNSSFDENLRKFTGTIVYSNTDEPKNSRVEYITGTTKDQEIQCDLRITDLQTTDSGNYQFRFIGSEIRYMSEPMTLTVTENPCKVIIGALELKNPLKESEEFTVNCFTFASCSKHPEWLNNTGQRHELISLTDMIIKTEEGDGRMVTTLKFNVTWKDDKRILSCRPGQDPDSYQIRNITLSVEYAPKETTANVSTEYVQEGDNVTLSCTSRGRPKVTFSWFKKEGIEKSQMSDFKLNPVKPEDSGNYFCEAKNSHGEMKSNIITIDVKYGPKDVTVKPLVNVTDLKEGDKLKLECSVKESNPEVKQFTWYNNNKLLQQTSNILFSEVTADNRGSYHCQANNYINSVNSNRILVSVKYSPRNLTIQGNHPVKVKTRLSLTCSADANPEPTQYTWKHTPGLSSFPLSSPNGQLNIDNVTIQHAGQYTCDATNTIGTRSHIINVDVLYPPSSVSLIMKSEVREFEVLSIICTVQSFPASNLTVTGPQYNLLNIQNNFRNITVSENKLTVYLNVTESDAGIYKCKGVNSEGKLEAQEDLTVLYAPKNVATSSKGEQTFGRELTLTCKAHSKPAASYEWKKSFNGQLKTVGHEQKLHFRSLSISDSGQFVCIVKNSIGENISQSVDIRVKYPPDINIVHNMTDERNWELPVYLTCSADAYPPASHYKWYREEDNTTVLSDQQNFTVQPQNPGMYYCTAANSIGKSRSKHIMLFVSNTVVLYRIILPIIFLLILIAVAIFMICRTINKARLDQQTGADYPLCFFPVFLSRSSTVANLLLLGSQNNTQENMSMEDILDPFHGRVNQSHPTPHSQDPTQTQDPYSRPNSNIHTVYSAIKLPPMTQGKQSPKSQKPGYMDNDLATSTLNYVTLDFKEQNEPKRAPEDSAVYAMVSKNKQSKNSESEHNDYENVSSACASRPPFNNIDWESDTSEEDEVNYTTVSCSAKPAVKEPKHNQRSHLGSSSSDDEDRTEYSAIKTVFK